jgi:hypothetical protein
MTRPTISIGRVFVRRGKTGIRSRLQRNPTSPFAFRIHKVFKEAAMGRGLLLWLLGVPIPVIILLWLFFGH